MSIVQPLTTHEYDQPVVGRRSDVDFLTFGEVEERRVVVDEDCVVLRSSDQIHRRINRLEFHQG